MITIIADEGKAQIGRALYQALTYNGIESEYISLENTDVKPCINCGGCTNKTYGRCVVRDDGDLIYPKVARSDILILVTPIVFGGYSFKLKRVLDKFGLFMDRRYFAVNGELTKGGMLDHTFKCFAIGIAGREDIQEADAFKRLFRELLIITQGKGKAYVTAASLLPETKNEILMEVMQA